MPMIANDAADAAVFPVEAHIPGRGMSEWMWSSLYVNNVKYTPNICDTLRHGIPEFLWFQEWWMGSITYPVMAVRCIRLTFTMHIYPAGVLDGAMETEPDDITNQHPHAWKEWI